MLTAGMSSKWTAKPKFYNDVSAQWQAILAVRKSIAATTIIDESEIRHLVIDLAKALVTHAPDASHIQAMLAPPPRHIQLMG